jgi:hypothetical protein
LQIARRAMAAAERPERAASVPTFRRPRVVLQVDRQPAEEPGAVVEVDGVPTLFVGRGQDWPSGQGQARPVAERFLGVPVVVISARSNAAAERARKRLRQVWRVRELLASGRLDEASTAHLRGLLDRL